MSVSREELIKVIGDFLEKGHVENIIAMFKQDTSCYELVGDILKDERFMVRMGVAVLFEELVLARPAEVNFSIPSLLPLLSDDTSYIRGEAATILAIINTPESLVALTPLQNDPDPQVAEIVRDVLETKSVNN